MPPHATFSLTEPTALVKIAEALAEAQLEFTPAHRDFNSTKLLNRMAESISFRSREPTVNQLTRFLGNGKAADAKPSLPIFVEMGCNVPECWQQNK